LRHSEQREALPLENSWCVPRAWRKIELKEQLSSFKPWAGQFTSKMNLAVSFKKHPGIATVINYHLFGNQVPQFIYDVHTTKTDTHITSYNIWKGQVVRELATLKKK